VIVVQSEPLVLLAPRFSMLRVRPDMVSGVQSEPLVFLGLGFSMLRIRLDAVSGILFAINRSDMRWVSIEIWSSDSKELNSRLGHGSRFSVLAPLVAQPHAATEMQVPTLAIVDPARGKRVIVIDDDRLVLDGMRGILQSWGCQVQTATSDATALANVTKSGGKPDLIISDYRLADGKTGIQAIGGNGAIDGAASALFTAGIAARTRGQILWCVTRQDLFAPALAQAGLLPDRVVYPEAGDEPIGARVL
jgi:CheY-like chemotaxis protein